MLLLTPPPESKTVAAFGYACDPQRILSPDPDAHHRPHDGCVGWWSADEDPDANGWRCSCSCHELGAGWPGYVA